VPHIDKKNDGWEFIDCYFIVGQMINKRGQRYCRVTKLHKLIRNGGEGTHTLNGGNTEVVGQFQGHHLPVSADFHDEQVASGVKDASHEAAVEGRRSPLMSPCTAVVELSTYGLDTGL